MRIWLLNAPTGAVDQADKEQILFGISINAGSTPVNPILDEAYLRRYLWDTN